jgi:hypothetical protein
MDLDHPTRISSHKRRHRVILDSRSLRNAARLQALKLPMKVLLAQMTEPSMILSSLIHSY